MKPETFIVAGAGSTTFDEVADLLDDYLQESGDVSCFYPASTARFTKSVANVVKFFEESEDDKTYPFLLEDEKVSRKAPKDSKALDAEDIVDLLRQVRETGEGAPILLVAIPDPEESPEEYDEVIDWIESAVVLDITVLDLTAGLDVVRLDQPTDTAPAEEPKPEPEPEKVEDPAPAVELQEEIAALAADLAASDKPSDIAKALVDLALVVEFVNCIEQSHYLAALGGFNGLPIAAVGRRTLTTLVEAFEGTSSPQEPVEDPAPAEEAPKPAEEPTASPKRGRGRPRVNTPTEKQIYDEDSQAWITRPRGRPAKGTKTRTVNSETGVVMEEAVV